MEHLPLEDFFARATEAGYNGIDAGLPEETTERKKFIRLLNEYQVPVVIQQHLANGTDFKTFCRSFEYYLDLCLECNPVLINSHTGKDYFSLDEQLMLIDIAQDFAIKKNVCIVHETHRGRAGFSPYNAMELFARRPEMKITADFSHWVCVTESYLENCLDIVNEAMKRTEHIHARVGYPQGPQVPDPRAADWQQATGIFMSWWNQVIAGKRNAGAQTLTITPEFGPPPYMVTLPSTGMAIADQFEINNYMKDILRGQ
jgi:sugar phosphate isomerase/epimerase